MKKPNRNVQVVNIRAGGPGGQNRNKRYSGVRITDKDTGIEARATERRSREQNLSVALERLEEKIERVNFKPKKRVDSKPTYGSKQERLKGKKKHSHKKEHRKKFHFED